MTSLVLADLLCILLVGGLRFGPGAVLAGAPAWVWLTVLVAITVALVAALRRDLRRGQAPWACRTRALLWLVFPGAAALNWAVGSREQVAGADLPALAFLFGLVVAVLVRRRPEWGDRWRQRAAWWTAARWVLVPTLGVLAVGVLRGSNLASEGVAFATYPFFALVQLAAALVLPATQWQRDGVRRSDQVAGSVLLFAFAHWPNPFATAVTAAGMLLWASAWQRGSTLLPLAISMGVCATVVTQSLPEAVTEHMRVGAGYALHQQETAARLDLERRGAQIEALVPWSVEADLDDWVQSVFEALTGQPCAPQYAAGVAELLEQMHREQMVRWVFDSPEFRTRHAAGPPLRAEDVAFFDSPFVPFLDAHAPYAQLVAAGRGLNHRAFTDLVYQALLGRAPAAPEYRHWPPPLTPRVRTAFILRLLRGQQAGEARRHWNDPEPAPLLRDRSASSP